MQTIDLTQHDGPALTTVQLSAIIGVSAETIRREIEAGELKAHRIGRGLHRRAIRIKWSVAQGYARRLGVI